MYDDSMPAPLVIAKGRGLMAGRIDSMASASGVPLVKNEELASGLAPVDVGEYVPPEYWELMARILVFIRKVRL
jgi:type III secretion system FlhB-like substrate exporter